MECNEAQPYIPPRLLVITDEEGHKSPTRSHNPKYPPADHPEASIYTLGDWTGVLEALRASAVMRALICSSVRRALSSTSVESAEVVSVVIGLVATAHSVPTGIRAGTLPKRMRSSGCAPI